ncbi:MAG: hypothetical protein V9G20_01120 [Candidatus Promineifilaceae bacterium]
MLFDGGQWTEHDAGAAVPRSPGVHRHQALSRPPGTTTIKKTGLNDAVIVGTRHDRRHPDRGRAAMEYAFIGGSMGVGRRREDHAGGRAGAGGPHARSIVVSCSGGARMMEGALSLMQMAKISAALGRLDRARAPLSVDPDAIRRPVASRRASPCSATSTSPSPRPLIGFAGPRVIEQTIRQKLPEGFQRSEFLLEKGFIDVDRRSPGAQGHHRPHASAAWARTPCRPRRPEWPRARMSSLRRRS